MFRMVVYSETQCVYIYIYIYIYIFKMLVIIFNDVFIESQAKHGSTRGEN